MVYESSQKKRKKNGGCIKETQKLKKSTHKHEEFIGLGKLFYKKISKMVHGPRPCNHTLSGLETSENGW
jgi:hypothetical protein